MRPSVVFTVHPGPYGSVSLRLRLRAVICDRPINQLRLLPSLISITTNVGPAAAGIIQRPKKHTSPVQQRFLAQHAHPPSARIRGRSSATSSSTDRGRRGIGWIHRSIRRHPASLSYHFFFFRVTILSSLLVGTAREGTGVLAGRRGAFDANWNEPT